MRNKEQDARQMEEKRLRILDVGFQLFSSRSIENVTMPEIAKAADVGRATLYRYFSDKEDLVLAIGTWRWEKFYLQYARKFPEEMLSKMTAAQRFELYPDAFITLYHDHKDLLRFNQFFNIYVQGQIDTLPQMAYYMKVVETVAKRFHNVYALAQKDGTLRTDIPESEMFASMMHLMMAAATRFALGLVYQPGDGADPETELLLLKKMLMREYCIDS